MNTQQRCGDFSLACVSCRQKFEKWQRTLEAIREPVAVMAQDHAVFSGLVELMDAARIWDLDRTFYVWVGHAYQEALTLRVRRLLDRDPKTHSLRLVLEDIARNSEVISRERFRTLYPGTDGMQMVAEKKFDELAGLGSQHYCDADAANDLQALLALADRVIQVADKSFAHFDKTPPSHLPTWAEAAESIELLFDISRKYIALICGEGSDKHPSPLPGGWTHVFPMLGRLVDEQRKSK